MQAQQVNTKATCFMVFPSGLQAASFVLFSRSIDEYFYVSDTLSWMANGTGTGRHRGNSQHTARQAPDGNALPIGREQATSAFNTATCIGCGACVASCRNASASLFVAAKLAHLGQLPQGQPERAARANAMQKQMRTEGFGSCSSNLECEAVCPQEISADWISWMHRERRC